MFFTRCSRERNLIGLLSMLTLLQAVKTKLKDSKVWVESASVTADIQRIADTEVAGTIRRSFKQHETEAKKALGGTVRSYFNM